MKSLLERFGLEATVAPSMREIPLEDNPQAFAFADELFAGRVDVVIFMTGVGARALLEAIETRHERAAFFEALGRCRVIVRGPKPTVVLREWNVRIDHRAPEPNTWRELVSMIDAEQIAVEGKTVAVQEYGESNEPFYRELETRGASVMPVPVYRWAFPEDTRPLFDSVRATIEGRFDVLTFTSAQQLSNVLQAAESLGLRQAWLDAAHRCVIASIGPTASERLEAEGLHADLEASPPKMGQLARLIADDAAATLARKRAGAAVG